MQLIWLLSLLVLSCSQDTVSLQSSQDGLLMMYSQGQYNRSFQQASIPFNCAFNNIYVYRQSRQQYNVNSAYNIIITSNHTQGFDVHITTAYKHFTPVVAPTTCQGNCTIFVNNNCPRELRDNNYFDIIMLNVGNLTVFYYFVLCLDSYNANVFEWGQFLLIIITVLAILFGALRSRFESMAGIGIAITIQKIIIFCLFLIFGGILSLFSLVTASILADIFSWIFGLVAVHIIAIQLLYKCMKCECLLATIPCKLVKVRVMDMIGAAISLSIMLGWWLSPRNWILNDLISICLIVSCMKVFKFVAFKTALLAYVCVTVVQISLLVTIQLLNRQPYDNYLLNNFSNPFQLQMPTFKPQFNKRCCWLSVTGIIFPGLLVAYLKRFDNSRNTKIYLITCICTFLAGSLLWMVLGAFSHFAYPFGLVSEPVMMAVFSFFAFKRKELRTLWEGKFYDQQFANKDSVEIMGIQMSKQAIPNEQFKDDLFKGLQLNFEDLRQSAQATKKNEGSQ